MNISEIKLNPKNPRIIRDEKFERLKNSIKTFPKMMELRPMVLDAENIVLGGNMRLKAIQELGMKEIPDSWVKKASELTEAEKREFIVKDNASFGEWDWDELANEYEVEELKDWGVDVPNFFGQEEAVEDDYEIPETIETDIVLGDLFEIGNHRLLCGDSTNPDELAILMNSQKADMVFTDPPYGVDYDGGTKVREKLEGDANTDLYEPCCKMAFRFSVENAPLYLWHAGVKGIAAAAAAISAGWQIRCEIIWNKNHAQFGALSAQYKQKHEPAYYCFKKGKKVNWCGSTSELTVWDIDRSSKNEHHPTQKPVALAAKAIGNHSVGLIADFFGGSGSTMVACEQMHRIAYLCEIDPKYCQVIVDRMIKFKPDLEVKKNGQPYVSREINSEAIA